jgi:hypothetical protein
MNAIQKWKKHGKYLNKRRIKKMNDRHEYIKAFGQTWLKNTGDITISKTEEIYIFKELTGMDIVTFNKLFSAGIINIKIKNTPISECISLINQIGADAFIGLVNAPEPLKKLKKDILIVRLFKKIIFLFTNRED